jgi:thiol-disulfide isomerase/thioredoxin
MKQFAILSTLVMSLLLASCKSKPKVYQTTTTYDTNTIEVIDFYGTHRCVTCKAIEASTKYTVETYFTNEPKVIFKTVNVDDDSNYKLAEKFEASGTALFLNVIKDGMETHIDLTDFGFSKGKDQEVFAKELKNKIEIELDKL